MFFDSLDLKRELENEKARDSGLMQQVREFISDSEVEDRAISLSLMVGQTPKNVVINPDSLDKDYLFTAA